MELVTKKRMMIFAGSSYQDLAQEVADHLGMRVGDVQLSRFANGELYARFEESVRGSDVFVLQSHLSMPGMSINDLIIEQLIMLDALKRASAKRTVAVIPYYGYSRSDKKARSREAIAARMVADKLAEEWTASYPEASAARKAAAEAEGASRQARIRNSDGYKAAMEGRD